MKNVYCRAKHVALVVGLLLSVAAATVQAAPPVKAKSVAPAVNAVAPGDGDDGGGSTATKVPTFFEQGVLVRSGEVIQPLGPNLMGDTLNEFSGSLAFRQTDVALPGNNALRVEVGRHLGAGMRQAALGTGLFGDWDLEIPRLHTVAIHDNPNWYGGNGLGTFNLNRCSQLVEPPRSSYLASNKMIGLPASSWWSGYQLYVPGQGDQTLFRRPAAVGGTLPNPIQPTDGVAYPVLTKQHWQVSCLSALERGTGEGFMVRAPDGTRYQFDHMVQRSYPVLDTYRYGAVPRLEIWILPTQVTDRFGNWVRYTYAGADGWRVASITSSDGRSITFTYNGLGNRIQSVSDGTRTWSYGYDAGGALQTVTQPDGSRWLFALGELERDPFSIEDPGCGSNPNARWDPYDRIGTITHPSGAVGSFTLKMTMHGRSNVPGSLEACEGPYYVNGLSRANLVSRYFATYSLTAKTLSGPGMPAMTWAYAYSDAMGSFAPCNGCAGTKTVTITDPKDTVFQKTYGTRFGIDDGLLLASSDRDGNTVLRTASYAYRASNAGPYPALVGYEGSVSDSMGSIYTPLSQRTITQQGVNFTQTNDAFNEYAQVTNLTRASTLSYRRSESTVYYNRTALWVLGQVERRTVDGVEAESTTFNDSTALPIASKRFGLPESTYVFNGDGTLASVTDGLNHTTTLTNYKRGLPQNIRYADGTGISGVVNNIGALTSITNEAGTTSVFGYDAMGRLASKTPPAGDAVAYHPTTLSFAQVSAPEYGLEPGHWRQTVTTGNAVTVNYFDARWRKRLSTTYDAADRASTERVQRFDYDPYNRTTFASYPARSIASITAAVAGTWTTYDGLGRELTQTRSSELGNLTTNTAYLSGFQKRVTNARGLATTFAYQAFSEPSENAITDIWAPEGVSVSIVRDVFDKPLSITRAGPWQSSGMSATRSYVYDGYHRLCKSIEPESGATVQFLDAASNLAWRASGQALPSTGSCDHASVPAASQITYGYDARNRLTSTTYGDGSAGIGRSYTADGLAYQVWSAGSTWTYGYNNRRLLVSEGLAFNGGSYNFSYGPDAYGNLASLTYPNGVVAYSPNALGQPTQASGYASGVWYHPNGMVGGYTLGNGVAHSTSQNLRGLPLVWRDSGVVQDAYSYDANANVTAITDQQEGLSSRTMGYDGQDRLTVANGSTWGSASFGYDGLDNLRTSTVDSRTAVAAVDANNRLSSLTVNGAVQNYGYDANGNLRVKGAQSFGFDIGNRLTSASQGGSYTYDGHGRRIRVVSTDGSTRIQVYSQAGQLLWASSTGGPRPASSTAYVYLGKLQIAESNTATGTQYVHTDALGSPVAHTNSGGQLLNRTRYEPYGFTAQGPKPGPDSSLIGFTGHVNDPETDLVYMQQRYYDPIAGRFLSVDPVVTDAKSGGHFGRYHYGHNNPYLYNDPDGRAPSAGGGFGFGWETVSDVNNFVDNAVTGGFGQQMSAAVSAGNYGEAVVNAATGVATGLTNVSSGVGGIFAKGVRALAARGTGKLGAVITSSTNSAGGTVVTASGRVVGSDFAGAVNSGLMRGGPVNILSGVHGEVSGVMKAERAFFEADKKMFGHLEGVNVLDVTRMTPGEIGSLLRGPGTTIGAFCESGACLAPLR